MPEIIIYTNDGDCANGVAEIQPFTTGDATDEWTLRFNDGTDFYSASNVTMRVGHVNGLPAGTYNNAFKWNDRTGAESTADLTVSSGGVPSLSISPTPSGGLVGNNGVYILRGPELDGSVQSATIEFAGRYLAVPVTESRIVEIPNVVVGGTPAILEFNFSGAFAIQSWTEGSFTNYNLWEQGLLTSVDILEAGSGFTSDQSSRGSVGTSKKFIQSVPISTGSGTSYKTIYKEGAGPVVSIEVDSAEYEFPFMRDESGNDIIAATTLSPYSDGDIEGSTQFNHSTLVVRPETVASASSLTPSTDATGPKWTATMDPINAYVTERLALRNSTQLDLQIRGDGRTLFQGQLTILNKIA